VQAELLGQRQATSGQVALDMDQSVASSAVDQANGVTDVVDVAASSS
jgi:hypothetical protein